MCIRGEGLPERPDGPGQGADMNITEFRMVEMLKGLKEEFGAMSVRAEFEAEGTKMEELLRLKEISMKAGVGLTLKIGGCESVRDMLEARTIGVNHLVAPMIDSPYALRKYLQAVCAIFPEEEKKHLEISCNIETGTAVECFGEILEIPELPVLDGIVVERVDLCFSMGRKETCVRDPDICGMVEDTLGKARAKGLLCTVGGGISAECLPFFRKVAAACLDRIETRKVCFGCDGLLGHKSPEKGIFKALGFELLWLRNKLGFYRGITRADEGRMALIEHRYMKEIDTIL
jgi:4-hydroxy-2-oxoheptanedioate aldolase